MLEEEKKPQTQGNGNFQIKIMFPKRMHQFQKDNKPQEEEQKPEIKGSAFQAQSINTVFFLTGFPGIALISSVITSLRLLSAPLKFLLAAAPFILLAFTQIPLARAIDENGGVDLTIKFRALSLIGPIGLAILSAVTDIETLSAFDFRYALVFLFSAFAGLSGSSFQLLNNTLYWVNREEIGKAQAIFGGVGGLGLVLAILLLHFGKEASNLATVLGIFAGFSGLGLLAGWRYLLPPPYQQLLIKKYTPEKAKAEAKKAGYHNHPQPRQPLLKTANDRRALVLTLAVYASLGGFFSTSTSIFITLKNAFSMSTTEAILATAAGSMWSTGIRLFSGKNIDQYDPSKGAYTFILASAIIVTGALMIVTHPSPSQAYVLTAKFIMDTGFGLGITGTFRMMFTWAAPKNKALPEYSFGTMNSIVGTVGAFSGSVFTAIIAAFVSAEGDDGYLDNFWFILGFSLITGLATWEIQREVTSKGFFAPPKRKMPKEIEMGEVSEEKQFKIAA